MSSNGPIEIELSIGLKQSQTKFTSKEVHEYYQISPTASIGYG